MLECKDVTHLAKAIVVIGIPIKCIAAIALAVIGAVLAIVSALPVLAALLFAHTKRKNLKQISVNFAALLLHPLTLSLRWFADVFSTSFLSCYNHKCKIDEKVRYFSWNSSSFYGEIDNDEEPEDDELGKQDDTFGPQ
jgi:hypothetical protein